MVRLANRHAVWFLAAGGAATLGLIGFFLSLPLLVPSLHVYLIGNPLWIPLMLFVCLAWLPVLVFLHPWLFAVEWNVSQDEIVFSLPAPNAATRITKTMPTGPYVYLIQGYLGLIAVKQNGDSYRLPRYLWTPGPDPAPRKLRAVLVDGRVGYHFV